MIRIKEARIATVITMAYEASSMNWNEWCVRTVVRVIPPSMQEMKRSDSERDGTMAKANNAKSIKEAKYEVSIILEGIKGRLKTNDNSHK